MKTFEDSGTAWIDDQLTVVSSKEFLTSLPDRTAAEAEKQSAKQAASLLREQAMALSTLFLQSSLRDRLIVRRTMRSEADAIQTGR